MDPRQPQQHPFARNTASPYGRTPFPPTSNQGPFPSSQPAPTYAEHQRRPSDPPYYTQQRSYAQDSAISGGHTRHQSASSIGTPVNRNMPPPSSPQQQAPHSYGPPAPRAPPVSVGPPSSFPSRELPTLPPLGRPGNNGSSMSISSMLGGPREPPAYHGSPVVTAAPTTAMFGPAHASPRVHASPRINTTTSEYPTYRRPQTPEHQRNYEPRDHRANSAGSPPGMGQYATPEGRRYGTPQQGYAQRVPVEERREPMRVPNPNAMPPRPNSQPAFNPPPPPRVTENPRPAHNEPLFGRRMDARASEPVRPEGYGRTPFEERHDPYAYAERNRLEREAVMQREAEEAALRQQREQRERAREHESNLYAQQLAQRNAQNAYNRPEPREQTAWARPGYEPERRYEPTPSERPPPPTTSGYEYSPATTAGQYNRVTAYHPTTEHRYGQPPQPAPSTAQHGLQQTSNFERETIDRQRMAQQEEQRLRQQQQHALDQQRQQQQPYQGQQYQHESPQRRSAVEESQPMQPSRSFLGVQEINRKGRNSPLPQAVQGAQGQLNGPGGEPSIKNEFGRMFSGIGMGVAGLGVPNPVSANAGMPFSTSGQLRRDDLESLQDSPIENGRVQRSASRQGGGRRRKLKEEDSRDEESTGRRTPSGNGRGAAKRAKTSHHHGPHHHHHHRPDALDSSPSQSNLTPFKSAKGAIIPSPPNAEPRSTPNLLHHHHVPRHHHHHHHVNTKPTAPINIVIPLVKPIIRSQEVLDEIEGRQRLNLGSTYYQSELRPGGPSIHPKLITKKIKQGGGFASTPKPLPRFENKENCLFTVKIPQVYLGEISRREITKRRAVWGTDVYTDDSDVIAACIHQGWFRGAWNEDVPVELLDLEIDVDGEVQKPFSIDDVMTRPPPTGPIEVPEGCECHVTVLILPLLQKYASLTRFGLKSREWGYQRDGYSSVHDGVSFMIHTVKWVSGVDEQEGRNRASRSKIFAKQLDNKELEEESAWDEILRNGNGTSSRNGYVQDSFERGPRPGDIQDTKTWLTGVNKPSPKGKEKEATPTPTPTPSPPPQRILGPLPPPIPSPLSSPIMAPEPMDEEEVTPNMAALLASSLEAERVPVGPPQITALQEIQIERVTERMIENANMAEEPSLPSHPPAFDPIATLAEIAVASEVIVAPVPVVDEPQGDLPETKLEKSEGPAVDTKETPSIFG